MNRGTKAPRLTFTVQVAAPLLLVRATQKAQLPWNVIVCPRHAGGAHGLDADKSEFGETGKYGGGVAGHGFAEGVELNGEWANRHRSTVRPVSMILVAANGPSWSGTHRPARASITYS